jgi:hypothetical protein
MKDSPRYQLGDGKYLFQEKGGRLTRTYVSVTGDSVKIYDLQSGAEIKT